LIGFLKRPQSGVIFFIMAFILGQKSKSEQMFDGNGNRIVVTNIDTYPCYIVNFNENETKGQLIIRLAQGKITKNSKPLQGQLKKAGIKTPLRFLKEMKIPITFVEKFEKNGKKAFKFNEKEIEVGMEVKPIDFFKKDDIVSVTGVSKGKGFQGVVRRHRFSGGPRTHGQSDRERAPGSIGSSTTPGRVLKGKRMAGKMGKETVTVKNLKIVEATDKHLLIKGLVPGAKGSLIAIYSIRGDK